MRHLTFHDGPSSGPHQICFLVPEIIRSEIENTYLDGRNFPRDQVMILDLHRNPTKKKTPAAEMKAYIEDELVPALDAIQAEYVVVCDAGYFKTLTGAGKVEQHLGYIMDSKYGDWRVVYAPNYQGMFYNPEKVRSQIDQALTALENQLTGSYAPPGKDIIKFAAYPMTVEDIADWLEKLLVMDCPLSVDIETFSLKHPTSGIGTITFCWSKHEGIAFPVDAEPIREAKSAPFIRQVRNERVRALLKDFFRRSRQRSLYHNISFDVYILIYQLFMEDLLDTEGLLEGLDVLLRNWDCTKLITYLAKNSCAGNDLSLKTNSQEFAGNYALEEIQDITKHRLENILEYNLVDGLATFHVYEKHWPIVVADNQEQVYDELFKPAIADIIQMQLTGAPLNMKRVLEVKDLLVAIEQDAIDRIMDSCIVVQFTDELRQKHVDKRNSELKTKQITLQDDETLAVSFNVNSAPQLQDLLYNFVNLPVIETTDSGLPATDKDTLASLVHHTDDQEVLAILDALADYKAVNKILSSFIPAFEEASEGPDGWHYLFGNFNLGGTISGRLSSSKPNMQNLPSNVFMRLRDHILEAYRDQLEPYMKKGKLGLGKLIKSCFEAPPGWVFVGLDFDSLEDRISALTTKDPNKLKVYTDGYDGHCLRAHSYFTEQMPDIDPTSVESINSIEEKYGDLRQESKAPTFALTYQGTVNTLVNKSGFDYPTARKIYDRYHEMYAVSAEWIEERLDQASKDGYVTVAFGLRVRTPLLKQVIRGTKKTPYAATAEGRSAGNAFGQSWCLLNSRAGSEFMGKVRKSNHRLDIRPCLQIHDAQYLLLRDDINVISYTNEHLVKAIEWQDHPDIEHDEVKLSGKLSIFYPTWAEEIVIPNGADNDDIRKVVEEALTEAA